MITFSNRKFLFVKTKKTASTSLELIFSQLIEDSDVATPLIPQDENYRLSRWGKKPQNYNKYIYRSFQWKVFKKLDYEINRKHYNHQPYLECIERDSSLGGCIPVTIVRNPIDQAKSNIRWLMKSRDISLSTAKEIYFDSKFLYNSKIISGMPSSSIILKYEKLFDDLKAFVDRFRLPVDLNELPHTKKSINIENVELSRYEVDFITKREGLIAKFYY